MKPDSIGRSDEELDGHPAPDLQRTIVLSRKQRFGLPILMAIPFLALFGVFGETTENARDAATVVGETVGYPDKLHYRQSSEVTVAVTNRSLIPLDTVQIRVDTGYLMRLARVRFDPSSASDFTVPLLNVKPGERRLVRIELAAEKYGRANGHVVAKSGKDSAVVALTTFIFP